MNARLLPFPDPLLLVVLHRVQPVAEPIAPCVQGGAGRDDLDEAEALLGHRLLHRLGHLADVVGRPAGHVHRAGVRNQLGQTEGGVVVAVGHRRRHGRGGCGRGDLAAKE